MKPWTLQLRLRIIPELRRTSIYNDVIKDCHIAAVGADQFESQGASFQGGYDSGLGGHQVSASSFESSSFG
ncbi:unnamed protein product, partial [Didymodactylos carnosus]